jgi:predicted DNA-binding transcriptional regulator YafY
MLGKYRGLPSNVWLEEVISNLEVRFGVKANSENLVSFDRNDQLVGLEFLSEYRYFIACISNQRIDAANILFGPDVQVVAPEWYRTEITKKIEETYKKYLTMQNTCTMDM